MKKFLKDYFTKPLKLNLINILLIVITVYLMNLANFRYSLLFIMALRLVALLIDYAILEKEQVN